MVFWKPLHFAHFYPRMPIFMQIFPTTTKSTTINWRAGCIRLFNEPEQLGIFSLQTYVPLGNTHQTSKGIPPYLFKIGAKLIIFQFARFFSKIRSNSSKFLHLTEIFLQIAKFDDTFIHQTDRCQILVQHLNKFFDYRFICRRNYLSLLIILFRIVQSIWKTPVIYLHIHE